MLVLMGGRSSEHEVSLSSAQGVVASQAAPVVGTENEMGDLLGATSAAS